MAENKSPSISKKAGQTNRSMYSISYKHPTSDSLVAQVGREQFQGSSSYRGQKIRGTFHRLIPELEDQRSFDGRTFYRIQNTTPQLNTSGSCPDFRAHQDEEEIPYLPCGQRYQIRT